MARTALLVLDMFNLFDFPDGQAMARAARRITPALLRLRQRFDRAGAPVIHVNDNFAHWRGEFADLVARCRANGGTPAWIAGKSRAWMATISVSGGGGGRALRRAPSMSNRSNSTGAARSPPKAPGTGVPSARPSQTPATKRPS